MTTVRLIGSVFVLVFGLGALAGCHMATHIPPGQAKKIINPPPGHGGIPPGQMNK